MKENTNKAIAVNSVILYVKMVLTTLCSILTTRYALQALGIVDFGLFSVLGGIITFVSIFNTIMLTTSNRFIAVAIGKNDIKEANKQFNVNLVIHVAIALCTLLVAFPIGDWYISHYINYDGNISKALMVFNITIIASIFSFIGVPYNGLLIAKERFMVFSGMDVLSHIGRMAVAYVLINHFEEKLFIYTMTMAFFTVIPVIVYIIYCRCIFGGIVKLCIVRDRQMYKDVTRFSAWVSIGAFATIGKNQGAALLVNAFFNTVMNTALGIANSICAYLNLFSQNITQPMAPQITKSYTRNDIKRTDELLLMSTKYGFLLMLLVSSPFLVCPEWILELWLGQVPPYSKIFLLLMIIDNLILSLNSGISNLIFASGIIKRYQIITSTLNVFAIIAGFAILKTGVPAYMLLSVYIAFSIARVIAIQWILFKTLRYNNWFLIRGSYIPCLYTAALFIPMTVFNIGVHPLVWLTLSFAYLCVLIFSIGLSGNERRIIKQYISRVIINRISKNK